MKENEWEITHDCGLWVGVGDVNKKWSRCCQLPISYPLSSTKWIKSSTRGTVLENNCILGISSSYQWPHDTVLTKEMYCTCRSARAWLGKLLWFWWNKIDVDSGFPSSFFLSWRLDVCSSLFLQSYYLDQQLILKILLAKNGGVQN